MNTGCQALEVAIIGAGNNPRMDWLRSLFYAWKTTIATLRLGGWAIAGL